MKQKINANYKNSLCYKSWLVVQFACYGCSMYTTQQQQQQLFYGPLSGTTRVSRHQKKTLTHTPGIFSPEHRTEGPLE